MKALNTDDDFRRLTGGVVLGKLDTRNGANLATQQLFLSRNTNYFVGLDASGREVARAPKPSVEDAYRVLRAISAENAKGASGIDLLRRMLADERATLRLDALENLPRLEEAAIPAIPQILELLAAKPLPQQGDLRGQAIRTLQGMGPHARSALPQLLRLASSGSQLHAASAAGALGAIDPDGDAVLPTLIQLLRTDPSPSVLASIRDIGPEAHPAVPDLIKLMGKGTPRSVRMYAARALGAIGAGAAAALPVLDKLASRPIPEGHRTWDVEGAVRSAVEAIRAAQQPK